MTDKVQLVREALAGNRQAFDALVHQSYALVYRFALRHIGDADDAADVTQNTFVRAYVGMRHLKVPDKFDAWLRQIALNECRKARQQCRVEVLSLDALSDENVTLATPSTEETVLEREGWRSVVQAIDALSHKDRDIAYAFFVDQQPYARIEAQQGISHSALATRLHRIRKQLSRKLSSLLAWLLALLGWRSRKSYASGGTQMGRASAIYKVVIVVAVVCVFGGAISAHWNMGTPSQAASQKDDKEKLKGTWVVVSVEAGGRKMPEEEVKNRNMSMTFVEDKIVLEGFFKGKGARGTFKLDSTKKPRTIDVDLEDEKDAVGIYELEKDSLKLCISESGTPRPTEFTGKGEQQLFVLKRK